MTGSTGSGSGSTGKSEDPQMITLIDDTGQYMLDIEQMTQLLLTGHAEGATRQSGPGGHAETVNGQDATVPTENQRSGNGESNGGFSNGRGLIGAVRQVWASKMGQVTHTDLRTGDQQGEGR